MRIDLKSFANGDAQGFLREVARWLLKSAAKVVGMRTILIVDDDQELLIRLERTLEADGCSTATAWRGGWSTEG